MIRYKGATRGTGRWHFPCLLIICCCVGVPLAIAQNQFEIRGTVLDPSGAAIRDAQVSLKGDSGAVITAATSNANGDFRLRRQPPGNYILVVQHDGFSDTELKLTLANVAPAPVRVVMQIQIVHAEITVAGEANQVSSDVSNNRNTTELTDSTLDSLPVMDQDYITLLSQILDPSAVGTNGVTLVVNGVEANGPGVTSSAIQSVKINNNPYSALFSRPGRARLEIVTKDGTPEIHGTVNFLFRDSVFDAQNAYASTKPSEQRRFWEGSLTGPLGHSKKTTFLTSLNYDQQDVDAIVLANTPSGTVSENVPQPMHHFFGSGRIFHNFNDANQFWVGYSYEWRNTQNQGVGGVVLPEAGYDSKFQEHEINISYTRIISAKWLNQLRFLVGHYDSPNVSNTIAPKVSVPGSFTGGGAQADTRNTEYHFDGNDTASYTSGRHELKFGIDVPDISRRGRDDYTNQLGTYSFATLSDFTAGLPETAVIQKGQGRVVFLEKIIGPFIEDTIRVRPGLQLTLGLRYYWQNYFGDDANNLAPRFGFAWAPKAGGKTIIRGGAGVFYDRTGPGPIGDLLHFNGVNLLRFIIDSPPYPLTSVARYPTSVVTLAPNAIIPYTMQWSAGVERQLTKKSTLSAEWISMRGIHLFRSVDANAPPPPFYAARPDATLGQDRQIQSEGRMVSNALEVSFRGVLTKYFTGQAQYRLAKTYDDTGGISWFPANSYFPDADWSRSDNDQRNRFTLLGTFNLPQSFQLGTAAILRSAPPYSELLSTDANGDGILNDRPAGVPRNSLHGPTYADVDVRAARKFVLSSRRKEKIVLNAGIGAFNVLNHRNDVAYIGTIGSPFFGRAVAANPPRRMQLNLELKF